MFFLLGFDLKGKIASQAGVFVCMTISLVFQGGWC